MKTIIVCVAITGMLTAAANAQNENVTWGTPTAISGDSDVNTEGALYGTWAPGDDVWDPDSLPVNGVTFNAYGSLPDLSSSGWGSHYDYYNEPSTPDANYNTILQAAIYDGNGNPADVNSFSWGGMTDGDEYLVEIWANDGRGNDRSETLTGGANTSAVLNFGNAPGEWIIGTFVADNTGDETISFSGAGSDNGSYPQVNLVQVRDITGVPEPATIAFLAIGAGAMLAGFRRERRVG